MKTNRLLSMMLAACMMFPVAGMAQSWLKNLGVAAGVVAGSAILNAATKDKNDTNAEENANEGESGEISTSSRPERITGTKVVTNHPDLEIKIKRCQVSGNTCVIDFLMTNYGNDLNDMIIYGSWGSSNSTAFDDEANEYRFSVQVTNSGLDAYHVYNISLLTDVPIKCRIQIEKVASAATVFKRIHLATHAPSLGLNEKKPIIFYNVPISREGDE